jgi:hypothetical protein
VQVEGRSANETAPSTRTIMASASAMMRSNVLAGGFR